MLRNFRCQENVRNIDKKTGNGQRIVEAKSCQEKMPKNLSENCDKRLFSITNFVLYANYFMLFAAECCLLMFSLLSLNINLTV